MMSERERVLAAAILALNWEELESFAQVVWNARKSTRVPKEIVSWAKFVQEQPQ
jgi:hypothetical protein